MAARDVRDNPSNPDIPLVLPVIDWPRFWIPQTGILDLSDAGFLRDPVDSLFGPGPLRTLAQLDAIPALALLGEPGSGKSANLKQEHERVSALAPEQQGSPVYVDLNVTSNEDRLYRQIFECSEVEAWKADDTRLYLLLDSLDEAMLRIETVPHLLAEGYGATSRSFVGPHRLPDRGMAGRNTWTNPNGSLGRVRSGRVRAGAPSTVRHTHRARRRRHRPDEFLPKLFGAQAVAFAIKPLTLKMLIALYKRDGRLPTRTGDLYRQGCLALCEETTTAGTKLAGKAELNGRQRLRLAGRIAVATALGHRFAVWNGPETETPSEDVAVSALAGAREDGDFPAFTTGDEDVREVLDTGQFSARGERRMGWAHQTYQEFLAGELPRRRKGRAAQDHSESPHTPRRRTDPAAGDRGRVGGIA